ncbi:MAG: hypothetical protein AAF989_14785, partial [Planctomycetota bacterium]
RRPSGDSGYRSIRLGGLVSTANLPNILDQLPLESPDIVSPRQWATQNDGDLDHCVQTQTQDDSICVTTDRWFFVRDADQKEHLFLKPDDRHDHNDVMRLRLDVVDEILEKLRL